LGAAATKYTVFASLSNFPIGYMTFVDGWVQTHWGSGATLYTEAAICVASMLVFVIVAATLTSRTSGLTDLAA
jgi:hypothetical protein